MTETPSTATPKLSEVEWARLRAHKNLLGAFNDLSLAARSVGVVSENDLQKFHGQRQWFYTRSNVSSMLSNRKLNLNNNIPGSAKTVDYMDTAALQMQADLLGRVRGALDQLYAQRVKRAAPRDLPHVLHETRARAVELYMIIARDFRAAFTRQGIRPERFTALEPIVKVKKRAGLAVAAKKKRAKARRLPAAMPAPRLPAVQLALNL